MIGIRLALVMVLAACASTAPERAYYLLRADVDGELAAPEPDAQVGIGPVSLAPYLDRVGLVLQIDAHRVREAHYHVWAEPLDQSIRQYLSDRVSARLGRLLNSGAGSQDAWRYRIDVNVEEFHGTLDGQARLLAHWSVHGVADSAVAATGRYSKTMPQDGDGYPSLVDAHIALLDGLAERIAAALGEVL